MRLLPPATVPGRVLAISVDLPAALLAEVQNDGAAADSIATVLSRVFESYNVPVTWGLDAPGHPVAGLPLFSRVGRHEIALRFDAAQHDAGDPQGLRKLIAQGRSIRQSGRSVSTLLSRTALPSAVLDTLGRIGVNLVANGQRLATSSEQILETLRFGMWQLSATHRIPGGGSWFRGKLASAGARRGLDRAIARNALYHLAIDAAALNDHRSAVRTLERILRHADRRRHQGMLQVLTLSDVARQLPLPRQAAAAHSILKSKAA